MWTKNELCWSGTFVVYIALGEQNLSTLMKVAIEFSGMLVHKDLEEIVLFEIEKVEGWR